MSQSATNFPTAHPEMAAQEIVMALVNAGAFGSGQQQIINSPGRSGAAAEAIIDIHTKLTEYYRSLSEEA